MKFLNKIIPAWINFKIIKTIILMFFLSSLHIFFPKSISAQQSCTGHITGNPGFCDFAMCPDGTIFDGISPLTNDECPPLYSCCTYPEPEIVRPPLEIRCDAYGGTQGIRTAIGCIPVSGRNEFLIFILPWAIGVAGGTAFVLIVVSGILFATSAGDPQRIKSAKQLFWSAMIGLLMIIFSVYLLDLIGVQLFRVPGL